MVSFPEEEPCQGEEPYQVEVPYLEEGPFQGVEPYQGVEPFLEVDLSFKEEVRGAFPCPSQELQLLYQDPPNQQELMLSMLSLELLDPSVKPFLHLLKLLNHLLLF